MFSLSKLSLTLASFALVASLADAQATSWNRRISDIHIVHPPGTPPGTWRVTAVVEVSANGVTPGTLSLDCAAYVEGTIFALTSLNVEPSAGPILCPGACDAGCSIFVSGGLSLAGSCTPVNGCHCGTFMGVDLGDINGAAGSTIQVVLTPTVGALTELDTSDDSMTRQIGENNPGTLTCAGDGTGVACPCANSGASGHGCANSANTNGAELSATGFTEVSLITGTDAVVLQVTDMPAGAPLLYFQGTSNAINIPFGDGTLCTTGSIIRLRVKINVGGASQFPEPGDPSVSNAGGGVAGSGATLYYQAYYRDAGSFCTSNTFNMTNGISLTWY